MWSSCTRLWACTGAQQTQCCQPAAGQQGVVDVCQHHTVVVSATRVPRACLRCSQMRAALLLLHAAHKDGLCELFLCAAKMSMYESTLGSSHSSLI